MAYSATPEKAPILNDAAFRWLQRDTTKIATGATVMDQAARVWELHQQPRSTETDLHILLAAGRVATATRLLSVAISSVHEPMRSVDVQHDRSFNLFAFLPIKAHFMNRYTEPPAPAELGQSHLGIAARNACHATTRQVEYGRELYHEGVRFFMDTLVAHAVWHPYASRQLILPYPESPDIVEGPVQHWNPGPGAIDEWRAQVLSQPV